MRVKNKHAATEDELGFLHKIATKVFKIKIESILANAEELDIRDAGEVINVHEVERIAKWAESNGITAVGAIDDETTELGSALSRIREKQKGRILKFTGTDDE